MVEMDLASADRHRLWTASLAAYCDVVKHGIGVFERTINVYATSGLKWNLDSPLEQASPRDCLPWLVRLSFDFGPRLANRIVRPRSCPKAKTENLVGNLEHKVRARGRIVPSIVDRFTNAPLDLMPGDSRIELDLAGTDRPYLTIFLN